MNSSFSFSSSCYSKSSYAKQRRDYDDICLSFCLYRSCMNTGFYCPSMEESIDVFCCGTATHKYCCTKRDQVIQTEVEGYVIHHSCTTSNSVPDPYSLSLDLDPDQAKNLNPDPSYFLTLPENKIKLFHNYKIFSSKEGT